jgi:hypothetical protein
MVAFAESGRKEDLIALLDLLDLTKVSSSKYISNIFKSLGRLELENYAEKLLQEMRSKGNEACASFPYLVHISLHVNKIQVLNVFSLPLNIAEPFLFLLFLCALPKDFWFLVSESSTC